MLATTSWWLLRGWELWGISNSLTCGGTSWPGRERIQLCWENTPLLCWSSTHATTPGTGCVMLPNKVKTHVVKGTIGRAYSEIFYLFFQPKIFRMTILSRLTNLTHLDDIIITEEEAANAARLVAGSKINQVRIMQNKLINEVWKSCEVVRRKVSMYI